MNTVTEENTQTADADLESEQPEEPKDALFDKAQYDSPALQLPKIDGEGIDRLALKFSGTVFLDRSDPADVAMIRRMALGHDITLQIEGRVSKKGYGYATDREGELDVVVQEHAIKVETVYNPVTPES